MKNTPEQKKNWLDQMENDIIPFVGRLIEKEKEHNSFLKKSKVELENRSGLWFLPWQTEMAVNVKKIEEMISDSDYMLNHFETRQIEYIEFVKQERKKLNT